MAPSLREIGDFMGIGSTNGVNDHLRALERRRLITREGMISRGIQATDKGVAAAGSIDAVLKDKVKAFRIRHFRGQAAGYAQRAADLIRQADNLEKT